MNCLICSETSQAGLLECNCSFCVPCVTQWLACQIEENFLSGDSYFRCLNSECEVKHKVKSILYKIPHKDHQNICQLMLRNYIIDSKDIVNCQNGNCKYYGIIPHDRCSDDLVCEVCGHRWREKSQMSLYEKINFYLSNMPLVFNEIQTTLYSFFFTVECPQCTIPIKKAGGCNHMTCKKCGHEFCWICKQTFSTHLSSVCLANMIVMTLMIGYFIFHIGFLLGIYYPIWNFIVGIFKMILKICFFNLTFFIIFLLVCPIICLCKEKDSIFNNKGKLFWYVGCFSLMSYVAWMDFIFVWNNYKEEFIWGTCIEVVLIWMLWTVDFIVQTWLKYVL